mmetsp:Transcript_579/g.1376  ORF Transcript_579/g.1376 Transcript_579/m.1376 type:complete len:266 (+) Transcript_579:2142-2939(+)
MSTELLEWRSDSGLIVNCNFLFRTFVASIIFTVVVVVVAVVVVVVVVVGRVRIGCCIPIIGNFLCICISSIRTISAFGMSIPNGTPHCFGLGLDSGHGVHDEYGTVEDGDGAVDFHGEVYVAGRVDQINLHFPRHTKQLPIPLNTATTTNIGHHPPKTDGSTLNRNPPLPLRRQIIRHGVPVVHAAGAPHQARQGEHAFRDGGLAGVDVGEDTDVAEGEEAGVRWMVLVLGVLKVCFAGVLGVGGCSSSSSIVAAVVLLLGGKCS